FGILGVLYLTQTSFVELWESFRVSSPLCKAEIKLLKRHSTANRFHTFTLKLAVFRKRFLSRPPLFVASLLASVSTFFMKGLFESFAVASSLLLNQNLNFLLSPSNRDVAINSITSRSGLSCSPFPQRS